MTKRESRFVVDREGGVSDRDSLSYRAAEFSREWVERQRIADEEQQKRLQKELDTPIKHTGKVAVGLFAVGFIGFAKAFSSNGSLGWWLWGVAGTFLTFIGVLFMIHAIRVRRKNKLSNSD